MEQTSSHQLAKLTVKNASFYAYHGVQQEEQALGGKFQVDLVLWYNDTKAAETDQLEFALNYEEVVAVVANIIHHRNYHLIEALAKDILDSVMQSFSAVQEVTLRLRKLHLPVPGIIDSVEIEKTTTRSSTK